MSDRNTRQHTNRLAQEKSPYLLQHAHNPVDWYPWGEEAFARARSEQKPIFLSIGYSTCHWCHVMERESFERDEVAEVLNAHFIAIKVDREERPDVDNLYMAATQAMTGSGGWPMSVFLTPELKPFFAGTYFPPQPAHGRPSFLQLLARIQDLWQTQRDALVQSGDLLTEAIKGEPSETGATPVAVDPGLLTSTFLYFERTFDEQHGGFGGAPKFPRPVQFDFLFQYHAIRKNGTARDMALHTLRKMAMGGMHDHLGGGFHRYSVDTFWRVSHFEKMLYDQAQLVHSYLDAYQITHEKFFADVVRDTVDYVLRDMTHPEGGFYSAEDADSEGEEGKFYAWTIDEVREALGGDADGFLEYYNFTPEGNFEHGKSVLHVTVQLDTAEESLRGARDTLFHLREKRVRPHLDDKILTSWNGLMIGAMARAGEVLAEAHYLEAARRAANFIWKDLHAGQTLLHRWREGEARFAAYLDSYAFLIKGYIELYESTFERIWLDRAIELQQEQDAALYDEGTGGYFMNRESPDILVRSKSEYDGAEPSGNSVSVINLYKLAQLTEDSRYREHAEQTLAFAASRVTKFPYAMPLMMTGIFWHESSPTQVVLAGQDLSQLKAELARHYLPISVRMSAATAPGEFASSLTAREGAANAYVCRDFTCELPVMDRESLSRLLAHEHA